MRGMSVLDPDSAGTLAGGPSFSRRHRLYRAVFGVVWALLAAWTPPPLFGWRRVILRAFGANISPTARVYGSTRIWFPAYLEMADYSVLGRRVNCYAMDRITLGRHAVVSQDAELCAGKHLVDDPRNRLVTRPISIGPTAWIAAGAFVGPGVEIGEGAVLGARGVAMSNLKPWTIYAGNPAQILRKRKQFDRDEWL